MAEVISSLNNEIIGVYSHESRWRLTNRRKRASSLRFGTTIGTVRDITAKIICHKIPILLQNIPCHQQHQSLFFLLRIHHNLPLSTRLQSCDPHLWHQHLAVFSRRTYHFLCPDRRTHRGVLQFLLHQASFAQVHIYLSRQTLLYVNYAAFILGILIFWADFGFYMLLRLGQGMCAGIFSSIVPLIIKELAPF